jgi:hypothetical protein
MRGVGEKGKRKEKLEEYKYGYPSTDKYRMNEEVGKGRRMIVKE